ncbi:DegT/DnrJ/EryC1/StrS family aminotransferase [Geoalkalibacter subterraneus]|uniref:Aminotransferase DegT n=1 Tax=Geoalkalibacter subterraneus TaxID=483547 RepID=A0A0B5FSL4_9BACT|nr:DegT/DnrJ/EryC1/StrS family aminotransferase [Geoalkalibacter subterraneus]AJF07644.1 aminotransferase DegT [Geoalkalibacter subterraneus]
MTDIPFVDLKTQQDRIRPQIDAAIKRVLDHGQYIMGPEVFELEEKLASFTGAKHCISCASGTDALLMALMSLGIGPGDEVITSPFTFVATGEVISLVGATPVFVDIDPRTFNIDPSKIAAVITENTRAIIPVSLFGLPADMDAIAEAVAPHPITVIEDAAQSFGATYKGRKSCNLSTLACTSFFPAKPLGCYGDGGAVFTSDDTLAETLRSIRIHGKGGDKYDNVRIGINGRLDTLQAAILLPKLDIFPDEIGARQKAAATYKQLLADLIDQRSTINNQRVLAPFIPDDHTSAWAQYSVLTASKEKRDNLQKHLAKAGVPTAVYYPKPLHLQTAYAGLGYKAGNFPVAENVAQRIVSLPMGPYVEEGDQVKVVEAVSVAVLDS